jgi:glycosyltransferase involved in cell wall biosynthesis
MNKKERNNKFNPLVTIITVVKNNEKYLEETIKSIKDQSYKNFEYIVVDGNSSDKSLDIIKRYDSDIDYWLSEEDQGIYDAFNKGLRLAKGKFIVFVNSDDILLKDAILYLKNYDEKYPNIDFLFGSVKKHWGILWGYRPWKIFYTWGFYTSHSTGFYVKKKAAEKIGEYNLSYEYSADYDYFYRMIVHHKLKGLGTKKEELFGIFRRGGYSSKVKFIDHFFETIKIRLDNGQNKLLVLIIFILKFLKNFNKL